MKRYAIGLSIMLGCFTAGAQTTKPLTVAVYTNNLGTLDEFRFQLALRSALRGCHFVRIATPFRNPLSSKSFRKYDVICIGLVSPGQFNQSDAYSATFFFADKTIIDNKIFLAPHAPYAGSYELAQEMNAEYFTNPTFRAQAAALAK